MRRQIQIVFKNAPWRKKLTATAAFSANLHDQVRTARAKTVAGDVGA